jgi:hypothetical protein
MNGNIKEQLKGHAQPGITGHDITDILRFAEDTRHMIVFDVLMRECPVGDRGERIRIFLSDDGYRQAKESEGRGEMKIICHARVRKGYLSYDAPKHGSGEH